jgi:NhaP-type Na+/H+ or K+/H+ antiporter
VLSLAVVAPGLPRQAAYGAGMAFVGVVLFVGVAALTRQHQRPYSATVFYLLLGALGSVLLGATGVGRLDPVVDHVVFERVTELALVIAVFGAGVAIERQVSRYSLALVLLLLLVVMPVTILVIAGFGMAAMGLPLGAAVLLGAVLAPTDPVLAGELGLGPPSSAQQGEPRFSLHTEAGANDGLATPFVLLGLFIAGQGGAGWLGSWVLKDVAYGIGAALVLGIALGCLSAGAIHALRARELFSPHLDGFLAPAFAFVVYGIAQAIGAYGLIAVFAAGITFRRRDTSDELDIRLHQGAELAGRLLEMAVLLLLGTSLTLTGLAAPKPSGWLLALLLIFVLRPVLVYLITHHSPLDRPSRLFLGFFGVRGVAAIYYTTLVAASHQLPHAQTDRIVWTTLVCVALSIIIHGITATPLTCRWLR